MYATPLFFGDEQFLLYSSTNNWKRKASVPPTSSNKANDLPKGRPDQKSVVGGGVMTFGRGGARSTTQALTCGRRQWRHACLRF